MQGAEPDAESRFLAEQKLSLSLRCEKSVKRLFLAEIVTRLLPDTKKKRAFLFNSQRVT